MRDKTKVEDKTTLLASIVLQNNIAKKMEMDLNSKMYENDR